MLSSVGLKNLNLLKKLINQFWGNNVEIINEKIFDAPFDMFSVLIKVNGRFVVLMEYDRSVLDISIKTDDGFIWLTDLAQTDIMEGFESCKEETLLYNFDVLDKTIKEIDIK